MFFKRSECGLEMRKYLYWIGLLAFITLAGSYWYLNHFLDEIGFDASDYRASSSSPGVAVSKGVDPSLAQPGVVAAPVAWPTGIMNPPLMGGEISFATVARDIMPAVVNVSTQNNTVAGARQNFNPANQVPAADGTMKFANPFSGVAWESIGSGVIVTADGYIVSNYHVVENSRNVFVTVFGPTGNQRYPAEVVQPDAARDLVLLKIKATQSLPVAPLGNSDELMVGEPVITVGCPFGLDQTVSKGIVSGLRKMVTIEGVVHDNLIQTDAAINQGNSGGPLVSANGQVVGINTAIYSPTQAFSGVGFAVPANAVRDFLGEVILLPDGANSPLASLPVAVRRLPPPIPPNSIAPHADRGVCENCHQIIRTGQLAAQYAQPGMVGAAGRNVALPASENPLGATLKPVDPYLIQRFRPPFDGGVFVMRVDPGSPSAQGGLQDGDLIFKLNGRWVRTPEELQTQLAGISAGAQVRLGVMRNRERREISVTLAAASAPNMAQPVAGPGPGYAFGGPGCARQPGGYPCPSLTMQPAAALVPVVNPVVTPDVGNLANAPIPPKQTATPPAPVKTEFEWQGMELQPITAAMVIKDPALKSKTGALVQETDPGLAADKAGLKANDVIIAINSLPVSSNADLDKAIMATNQASTILLDVDRGGQRLLVTLK
ncbi:Putative magnetosome protein MamE containing serine cysteine peptidase [Gammaproteobacteria bacterium]